MGLACENGILKEALVDKNRIPTTSYRPFVEGWKKARIRSDDRDIAPDYYATYVYHGIYHLRLLAERTLPPSLASATTNGSKIFSSTVWISP